MSVEWWVVTTAANVVIAAIYGVISYTMVREAVLGQQWVKNPLLSATVAIFVTCTVGHGLHAAHTLLGLWGAGEHVTGIGHATRTTFMDGRLLVWDALTALVAIWYWSLRSRFAILFHGAALCEDMTKRQQQASDIHDNVVQGLVKAKFAMDLGRRAEGRQAIAETLEAAKKISSGLLGLQRDDLVRLGAGDLRRNTSAK